LFPATRAAAAIILPGSGPKLNLTLLAFSALPFAEKSISVNLMPPPDLCTNCNCQFQLAACELHDCVLSRLLLKYPQFICGFLDESSKRKCWNRFSHLISLLLRLAVEKLGTELPKPNNNGYIFLVLKNSIIRFCSSNAWSCARVRSGRTAPIRTLLPI
jgi:hypothetical protein